MNRRWTFLTVIAVPLVAGLLQSCATGTGDQAIATVIRRQIAVPFRWFRKPTVDDDDIQPLVRRFYRSRSNQPAWTHLSGPTDDARELVKELAAAPANGLDPETYDTPKLQREVDSLATPLSVVSTTRTRGMARLDVALTRSFLKYAIHRSSGQVNPLQLPAEWHIRPHTLDAVPLLEDAIAHHRVRDALEGLDPKDPQYVKLRDALARERDAASHGGDPGAAARIRQIELNLERHRWVPDSVRASQRIEVNIPSFTLDVIENDRPVLSMPVVVGKQFSPTPVFADEISYLVFNPRWNVPPKIAATEILPEMQKDPSTLERQGLRIYENEGKDAREVDPKDVDWKDETPETFHYAVRADPGPQNPLGHVKFMCPNQFDVYLHDTPAGHLFSAQERGFSHGCIRVQNPAALAAYLLRDKPGWDETRIQAAFSTAMDSVVTLPHHVPVDIVYWTASVDDTGRLRLDPDIYGLDRLLDTTLRSRRPAI